MLLYGLRNWTVDGQNQNIHCKQVCLAVAMVVAVEILAAAKRGVPPSIGIGGFLLAPLSALESFLKSKLKTFVEAFGPWLGVVDEELDVLLASDLMQGGVEKIMFFFFLVGVRCTKQIWRVAGRRVDARAFGCSRLRS